MRLPGLKHRLQPQQLHRVDDLPRQRVLDRLFGAHAAAFGAGFAGVEVERVEALVVLDFWWCGGIEGWRLWLSGLERGLGSLVLLGRAERGGRGDVGGADEGVGEVVGILLWGVGVGFGELFYSGVLGHCCVMKLEGGDVLKVRIISRVGNTEIPTWSQCQAFQMILSTLKTH